ncbi:hypothetical protein PMAYCL1PPCAC_04500, partial [Pristionchus mayeri]
QAAECRRGLDASLQSVHESMKVPKTSSELLLHRMNAVLCAAAAPNMGAGCPDAINSLYESIESEQRAMCLHNEDLSLLQFSRSFAVVLETITRQLQRQQKAAGDLPSMLNNDEESVKKKEKR